MHKSGIFFDSKQLVVPSVQLKTANSASFSGRSMPWLPPRIAIPSNLLGLAGTLLSVALITGACASGDKVGGPGDEVELPDGAGECVVGESRCKSGYFQECVEGAFEDAEFCFKSCDDSLGCVQCRPERGPVCVGDEVHACAANGTIGDLVEVCSPGQCGAGSCDIGIPDCAVGADLIYVVDDDDTLLSFDPRKLDEEQDPFTMIGEMSCPAGRSWPDWDSYQASPFSMSVDRDAKAWVLYTSGEIFHVSTEDASCQATGFSKGQEDFELFGMGFVAESAGSSQERLWIAGTTVWDMSYDIIGDLGYIDTETLEVTRVGSLPTGAPNSPELTGTGNGNLFGFYPGSSRISSQVARINKDNARHDDDDNWSFTEPGGDVVGWAFAHWGGNFYIFVTTQEWGSESSQVLFFDRQAITVTELLSDLPYKIVGAGVSTCAPVVVD